MLTQKDELQLRIERASKNFHLDLSKMSLDHIPSEIKSVLVSSLNLSDNLLSQFSSHDINPLLLDELDISNNNFSELPLDLSNLQNLRKIISKNNKIAMLGNINTLSKLKKLVELDISHNKI